MANLLDVAQSGRLENNRMARTRSRMHRRYSRNPAPRSNPPLITDIMEFVVPGFAGFGATRLLSYVAATQVARRKPSWGKHVGAIAAGGSFLAAWLLAHRVKFLEKHHTPIVVGAAIAALQSLIQLYLPQLGWMLADPTLQVEQAKQVAAETSQLAELHPVNLDPNEYTYNDAFDPGRFAEVTPQQRPVRAGPATSGQAQPVEQMTDDDIINDAIGGGNEYGDGLGVFATSN